MKQEVKPPKKSFIIYLIIISVTLLFFIYLLPISGMHQNQPIEVPYNTFLEEIENETIREAVITDSSITFIVDKGDNKVTYITGQMDDPDLIAKMTQKGITFKKELPTDTAPIITYLLIWILPIILVIIGGQFIIRQANKNMNGTLPFGKSGAKIYVATQTGKTFADVAGEDEAKTALKEIVDFLHDPTKYKDIGARLPKGALLVGPPGTGKTLLAKAVAGEAGVPFFSISGSEFVEMLVGVGASRVRDLFKQATEHAPCIVFIDEIDAIGKKRDGNITGGNDEREQTLNQLLTEMDGFDANNGIVILAATNRPENLDQALLRPGRFDRRIPVELPDVAGREAILKVHAKNVRIADDINYHAIALATSGTSGAELANIINEAALLAVKDNRKQIEQRDLEESIETVLAGYQRKGAVISPQEKKIISYHEIGHALVAACQKASAPVHKITIIPRTSGTLGYTMQVDEEEHYLMTREELINKITTLTAGRAAEELIFNQATSGAANDIEQATKIARTMITRLGMSDEFDMVALAVVQNQYLDGNTSLTCSQATATRIDEAVTALIRQAHERATEILRKNEHKLHELSAFLLERETISGEEFMAILNKQPTLPAPESSINDPAAE